MIEDIESKFHTIKSLNEKLLEALMIIEFYRFIDFILSS